PRSRKQSEERGRFLWCPHSTSTIIFFSYEELHELFRSFDKPIWTTGLHFGTIAHPVPDRTNSNPGVMPPVDVVGTVADEYGLFLRHIQLFYDMQQHARLRF